MIIISAIIIWIKTVPHLHRLSTIISIPYNDNFDWIIFLDFLHRHLLEPNLIKNFFLDLIFKGQAHSQIIQIIGQQVLLDWDFPVFDCMKTAFAPFWERQNHHHRKTCNRLCRLLIVLIVYWQKSQAFQLADWKKVIILPLYLIRFSNKWYKRIAIDGTYRQLISPGGRLGLRILVVLLPYRSHAKES